MEQLKNLVKKLIAKEPSSADPNAIFTPQIEYKNDNVIYRIAINHIPETNEYVLELFIEDNPEDYDTGYNYYCNITEKEYMEIKWNIEAWHDFLVKKEFDRFAEFAEQEQSSMDELLND